MAEDLQRGSGGAQGVRAQRKQRGERLRWLHRRPRREGRLHAFPAQQTHSRHVGYIKRNDMGGQAGRLALLLLRILCPRRSSSCTGYRAS